MKKPRARRLWLSVIGVLLLGAVAFFVVRQSNAEEVLAPGAVVVEVERGVLVVDILDTGKIEPPDRVEIKSKIAGQVAAIGFDEGDVVRAGDVLLVLDPTDMKREVARAEAEALAAKHALDRSTRIRDRSRRGVDASVVAVSDLEFAETEAKLHSASLRVASVALESARDRLRYTEIVAPIDGVVLERNVQPGEVVVPGVQATFDGKPLLTLGDVSRLEISIDLNQIDVVNVKPGQRVEIRLDALRDHTLEAIVTRVAPASVRRAGREVDVFPVKAELVRGRPEIRPGMTADVRIRVAEKPGVLKLPMEAVRTEGERTFVKQVVRGEGGIERVILVDVRLGTKTDREVEITSGLDEGDRVLVDPAGTGENEMKL